MMEDQFQGRFAEDEGVPEIALSGAFQEQEILLPDRPVETETADRSLNVRLVCIRTDQHIDRVADDVHAEEDDDRHEKDDKERLHQSTDDENSHWGFST